MNKAEKLTPSIEKGLAGVYVDTTAISNVEGELGRLSYRGYLLEELISQRFEAVVWLVLFGEFPDKEQLRWLSGVLRSAGHLTDSEVRAIAAVPTNAHPMQVLQSMLPLIAIDTTYIDNHYHLSVDALAGLLVIAKMPALIAAYHQLQNGRPILIAQQYADYHDNFLHNFTGEKPQLKHREVLDVTQILQMEHSFNAGTFACRVVASTLAPLTSCVSAAIGALYGKLHGGADEAAVAMAQSVGDPEQARAFVLAQLAAKQKIMGMGHREYRTVDPRAKILKPMAKQLCKGTPNQRLFQTLENVEGAVRDEMLKSGKDIWANVEFYKGAVFVALDIPPNYFTAMFAMARMVGYVAHFLEARWDNKEPRQDNKLIRPKAWYVGHELRPLPRQND